ASRCFHARSLLCRAPFRRAPRATVLWRCRWSAHHGITRSLLLLIAGSLIGSNVFLGKVYAVRPAFCSHRLSLIDWGLLVTARFKHVKVFEIGRLLRHS